MENGDPPGWPAENEVDREGYVFEGWYFTEQEEGRGDAVKATNTVTHTEAHPLYAHWRPKEYKIRLIPGEDAAVEPSEISVTYAGEEQVIGELPKPTKTGHTFKGWFTQQNGEGIEVTKDTPVKEAIDLDLDESVTQYLYAHWEPIVYYIDYDPGYDPFDGDRMDRTTVKYGELTPLRDNTYTREGYSFDGWYIAKDYKGADEKWLYAHESGDKSFLSEDEVESGYVLRKYYDGDSSKTLTGVDGTVITLVAQWKEKYAKFSEYDRDYRYLGDEYGDYKILANSPDEGGLNAEGQTKMVLNATFSLLNRIELSDGSEYAEQIFVGCTQDSGWSLRVDHNGYISFILWNEEENKYDSYYDSTEKIHIGDVYNVTVVYNGDDGKVFMYIKNITDNTSKTKEFSTEIEELDQKSDMPTLIGENPISRIDRPADEKSYDKDDYTDNLDKFYQAYDGDYEKYETSAFDGKVYNVKLWYDRTVTDTEVNGIFQDARGGFYSLVLPVDAKINSNNSNRYKLFTEPTPITWEEAKEKCEEKGGHLVTITSAAEQNFVYYNFLKNKNNYDCWIGGTDKESEGDWKWVTGEPFSYTKWSNTEPNNMNGNEYYINMYSSDGTWNDMPASTKYRYYICEWEYYIN